jgi:hypothetical protein
MVLMLWALSDLFHLMLRYVFSSAKKCILRWTCRRAERRWTEIQASIADEGDPRSTGSEHRKKGKVKYYAKCIRFYANVSCLFFHDCCSFRRNNISLIIILFLHKNASCIRNMPSSFSLSRSRETRCDYLTSGLEERRRKAIKIPSIF